jgi:aspartate-semialdehyde dehydrogenase
LPGNHRLISLATLAAFCNVKHIPVQYWLAQSAHTLSRKNAMKNVGFIGWRGMVGSVLMQRMVEERDFDAIRPVFFSTSQLGQAAPSFGGTTGTLQDASIWKR